MEEKIKDIFNNIKERLSNPFLFSFLIAFLVYNWEITLSIFYNDYNQIKAEGFKSIFEFVRNRWDNNGKLFMPFLIALLYTFVFPIFRNLVNAFQTWIIKWGEDWNLKISKDSKIGIDKYLALRDNYIEKTKSLEEIIESESKFLIELEAKSKEVEELKNENLSMKERVEYANNYFKSHKDLNILNGIWEFKFANSKSENKTIKIEGTNIFEIDRTTGSNKPILKYEIMLFNYFVKEGKVEFVKKLVKIDKSRTLREDEYIVCELNYINENKLRGSENGFKVEYSRNIDNLPF